jgi:hypothetical protein
MIPVYTKLSYLALLTIAVLLQACTSNKKIYMSDCDENITFKHVTYTHLIDSIAFYDQKYIEVSGKYQEGKEESALINDSLFVSQSKTALWVNFSQDCPLYLSGTRIGFFEYNNGGFTRINNKTVKLRGRLDVHNKGHLKLYKACIDRVSFIEL